MSDKPNLPYVEAAHGIQTGIAYELERDPSSGTPKHLRVGINMAMSDAAGLAKLLMDKGIFTPEEYADAVTQAANDELERIENAINERFGANGRIKLR